MRLRQEDVYLPGPQTDDDTAAVAAPLVSGTLPILPAAASAPPWPGDQPVAAARAVAEPSVREAPRLAPDEAGSLVPSEPGSPGGTQLPVSLSGGTTEATGQAPEHAPASDTPTASGAGTTEPLSPAVVSHPAPQREVPVTTAALAAPAAAVLGGGRSAGNDTGGAAGQGGSLLPAGYLSTDGNQIVDAEGNPVRIASVGWSGTDSLTFAPYGLWQSSLQENVDAIKADGFNTIRVPWSDLLLDASPEETASYAAINPALDPELVGATSLQLLEQLVADAGKDGLKVIFDHHDDDGGPGGWGGQQANGLWIDSGPGTDGTDGSGTTGTVDAAKFLADSVALAQAFAGNSTVIGFDLDNEPTSAGNINWGQGGPTDIQAMYTEVGDAIQAVDPGALIIAEGPEEWSGPAPGMPAGFAEGDLSGVATDPVSLAIPNKVVYSVHEYPPDLSGNGSYNAATQIAAMNAGWGYLETDDIAPVWVGEIGSNMTSANDAAWIQTLLDYMNGDDGAAGGPTFSGNEQPVSASWWQWGVASGEDPQGVEEAWGSGTYWAAQQAATDQLLYMPEETVTSGLRGIACYVAGTLILTDRGEVAVESLAIGDRVVTRRGRTRPIRWIGRRSYDGRFIAGNPEALPILFRRGALADAVPRRDLLVSPRHAMHLDGVLIEAAALVNGVSIRRLDAVARVDYFHVELASHDVILAEGAWSESFVDDNSRCLFHNATDYTARPRQDTATPARYCAKRVASGPAVARVRRRLGARLHRPGGRPPAPGDLLGRLDEVGPHQISGWARSSGMPDEPVRLRIFDNGAEIAEILADAFRPDLAEAGIGSGCHSFRLDMQAGLSPLAWHVITVQRAADGAELPGSPKIIESAKAKRTK